MSRECARSRARERAELLDEAIGHGVTLELLGVPFVVLFAEPRWTPPPAPRPGGTASPATRSGPRST